jgi:TRAP-type uncharacterized transport system substrate-binding protein
VQLVSAIATRLTATSAPVRLKVLDEGTALDAVKAFSTGQADLAVVRADIGDLSNAETVVVVTRAVVLMLAPPGGSVTRKRTISKAKTVGVVGAEVNHQVVNVLTKEYALDGAKTHFKDLAVADIPQALKSKQVNALLVVMPIADKSLATLRALFPRSGKQPPALIPIESAGAITAVTKYYQSYDLPKGTVQGSPPIPDDDMKTLQVPLYLVANKKPSDDVVSSLAKAIMDARHDLIGENPLIARISEPDTDKTDTDNDTYIPIHPGAAAYFGGDVQSFFDKYGAQLFYGSMLLGTLTSLFAAAWKFLTKDAEKPEDSPLMRLHALTDQIRNADNEADLTATENHIDEILKGALEKCAAGNGAPTETAALGLATHRLEHLIAQRREALNGRHASA